VPNPVSPERLLAGNNELAGTLVSRLLAGTEETGLVRSVYLTGSRSTEVHRPDSDWDLTFVIAGDAGTESVSRLCRHLADRLRVLRREGGFPGELAAPKITSWPVLRRCLGWDAPTFGELFWRHAVLITGAELRSGPLLSPGHANREPLAGYAVARSVILVCHHLWRTAGDGMCTLPFSHVGRILRALAYRRDGDFPIAPEAYPGILWSVCGLAGNDPVHQALTKTDQGRVTMSVASWARLIEVFCAAIGAGASGGGARAAVWLPNDRPVPWPTRWSTVDSPAGLTERRDHPAMPSGLARLWREWTGSPSWRSTLVSYFAYNRWNKLVDALDGSLRPASLREDADRIRYALTRFPLPGIPAAEIEARADRVHAAGDRTGDLSTAWGRLCELADPGDGAIDPPGLSIRDA